MDLNKVMILKQIYRKLNIIIHEKKFNLKNNSDCIVLYFFTIEFLTFCKIFKTKYFIEVCYE
jgi:hypothetical protein